jgi:hypothetical protein
LPGRETSGHITGVMRRVVRSVPPHLPFLAAPRSCCLGLVIGLTLGCAADEEPPYGGPSAITGAGSLTDALPTSGDASSAGTLPDPETDGDSGGQGSSGSTGGEGTSATTSGGSGPGTTSGGDPSTTGTGGDPSTSSTGGDPSTSGGSTTGGTSGDPSTTGSSTSDGSGGSTTGEPPPPPPPPPTDGTYARGIVLGAVEATQGVAIALGEGTQTIAAASRNARLVRDRELLIRAGWSIQSGFTARPIEGRLILEVPGRGTEVLSDVRTPSGSPNFSSYNGTFRWAVPAELVQPGTTYRVALYEQDDALAGTPEPNPPPAQPATGAADLGIPVEPMELEIVFVPVRYTYNGNDRTPNLSAANIETLRQDIYENNPVSAVNVSVRSTPVTWSQSPNLSNILQAIGNARDSDSPADNVYYEGLIDVGCFALNGTTCSNSGGTTGIGYVAQGATRNQAGSRASVSVFYNVGSTAGTVTHELGHNQGLNHVGCGGAAGADPNYPYSGGRIGVQGWVVGTTELIPSSYTDYMSYCNDSWVSDWTWEKTANYVRTLTSWGNTRDPSVGLVLQGIVAPDGSEQWVVTKGAVEPWQVTSGQRVQLRDGGRVIAELAVAESELSEEGYRVLTAALPPTLRSEADVLALEGITRVEGTRTRAVRVHGFGSTAVRLRD